MFDNFPVNLIEECPLAVTGRTVFMFYSQDSFSFSSSGPSQRSHDLLVLRELRMGIIVFVFLILR